jgi:pilus assembly protein Flp/PilA
MKGGDMFLRIYTSVTTWWDGLVTRAQDEGGATAVEYALMVALIAVVIIAAVAFVGHSASKQFHSVGNCIDTPSPC